MAEVDPYEEVLETDEDATTDEVKGKSSEETDESGANESQSGEPVITKEFAEKHGLSKDMVGKSYDELGKAFSNIQKFDTKLSMQVADMQKKMGELEIKFSQKEVKQVEKEVEDKLPDYDAEVEKFFDAGILVDPKGYAAFNRKYYEQREKLLTKEFEKKLNERDEKYQKETKSTTESLAQIQEKENRAMLYDTVAEGLSKIYEEVTPEMVDSAVAEFNETLEEADIPLYKGRMKKLGDAILTYHKAQLHDKKTPKSEVEKAADNAHKKTLEKLKNTDKKFTQTASSARDTKEKIIDKDYDSLLEEAEEEADWTRQ